MVTMLRCVVVLHFLRTTLKLFQPVPYLNAYLA